MYQRQIPPKNTRTHKTEDENAAGLNDGQRVWKD
jgi:hypothetical protein